MNLIETRRFGLDALVSAAIQTGADLDGTHALVWQQRGLVLRIGEIRQQMGFAAKVSPEIARTYAEYRTVRAELARLAMAPVEADRKRAQPYLDRLKACGERKERLEAELARLMPALGRQFQAQRRSAAASCGPNCRPMPRL